MKSVSGNHNQLLEQLKRQIEPSLTSVTPLRPAWQRSLVVLACGLLLAAGLVWALGLRDDSAALGPVALWCFSLLQLAAVYFLFWLILKEGIPASKPSRELIWIIFTAAVVLHLAIVLVSNNISTNPLPVDRAPMLAAVCLSFVTVLGLPLLLVGFRLVTHGLPDHWGRIGLLVGFSVGLSAEAAWRLHCPYSDWTHILSAHSVAIALLACLGALVGNLWMKHRR